MQRYFAPGDTNVFIGPGIGVVLGEPGFDLGERGRRDRFGPRRGESLFPRESGYTKLEGDYRCPVIMGLPLAVAAFMAEQRKK